MAMDAITVLTEDHRAVNRAFLQYEDLHPTAAADRREIVDEITRRLVWHTATEQQFLHPLLKAAIPDGEDLVTGEINGHDDIITMLRTLATFPAESDEFDAQVRKLIAHVRRHMESEEQSVFPILRNVVDWEYLTELGEAISAARAAERTKPVS
jgi:hemerythrin-like domain-containing protein